jgi:hypothetical protein
MQKKGIFLFGTRNAISKVAPFNFTAMKRLNAIQSKNLNFLKFFIISLLFVFLAGQTQSIWNELYHNKSAFSKISLKNQFPMR